LPRPEGFAGGVLALLLGRDRRCNRADNHGRHLELRDPVLDVVTPGDPLEIGPDRPYIAVVVLRQSSPAFGLDVMNWVPSGGFPNTSRVEGRSLMPASAASFD
jgi:hypothetical protein